MVDLPSNQNLDSGILSIGCNIGVNMLALTRLAVTEEELSLFL